MDQNDRELLERLERAIRDALRDEPMYGPGVGIGLSCYGSSGVRDPLDLCIAIGIENMPGRHMSAQDYQLYSSGETDGA